MQSLFIYRMSKINHICTETRSRFNILLDHHQSLHFLALTAMKFECVAADIISTFHLCILGTYTTSPLQNHRYPSPNRHLNATMQAWHKEQKDKAIKKSKASQQKERNEKLGRRNPDRLQRQIDELKTVIEAGRDNAHNRQQLADLEKDLAAVRRARKALGIEDEARAGQKRRREGEGESVNAGEKVEESDSGGFLYFVEEEEE